MTPNVVKTISIVIAAVFASGSVAVIFLLLGSDDAALQITFVALISAGTSVDLYQRLSRRYLTNAGTGKSESGSSH